MNTYLSTFAPGFEEPVEYLLKRYDAGARIIKTMDGLIVYNSHSGNTGIRCFNNTFLVIRIYENPGRDPVRVMAGNILRLKGLRNLLNGCLFADKRTFRIITSSGGSLVPLDKRLLGAVEARISELTGLKADRSNPDIEFWLLYRNEKIGFFLLRLTRHTAYEKLLHKGELRPEIAYLLCAVSKPSGEDVVLDPFCGYASIPAEWANSFSFKRIFAFDKDEGKAGCVIGKLKKLDPRKTGRIVVRTLDSLHMGCLEDGCVDRIITDPPWGLYEKVSMGLDKFYVLMLKEFLRVLRTGGAMVVLTAGKREFESALSKFHGRLEQDRKYDVLISGKKAAVYRIVSTWPGGRTLWPTWPQGCVPPGQVDTISSLLYNSYVKYSDRKHWE